MILTNCAACAAPLAHNAPRCIRCHTRYCDATCQHDHWRRGHKQICKKIHRGGNAEQYHADKKYKEAVAVAVEACAADTKGQKCYICLESVHSRTGEGLVRGCGCGDRDGVSSPELGVAHVSCLARQAKESIAEAEENNLGGQALNDAFYDAWQRWHTCSLCGQRYHGVVSCAYSWACWKTYVGRPETATARRWSMTQLGHGLFNVGHHEEAVSVREAELSMEQRLGGSVDNILSVQGNLAGAYYTVGRFEEALSLRRDVYAGTLKIYGENSFEILREANNYAVLLKELKHFTLATSVLRKSIRVARRVLGENHTLTLTSRSLYAQTLLHNPGATLDEIREAINTLEEMEPIARRALGIAHPIAVNIQGELQKARALLRAREAGKNVVFVRE